MLESLSARRAWIEIFLYPLLIYFGLSLSARRAWIEIWCVPPFVLFVWGRSPQGERG